MAVKKHSTDAAAKSFEKARGFALSAKNDPNDPASPNLLAALHEYFTSIASAQVVTVEGINDLLERVDRIETKLNLPRK